MELEELHVLERQAVAPDDRGAVTGQGVRVGGDFVHLAEAAAGEDDRFGLEQVQLARCQFVRNNAGDPTFVHHHVEYVELVVELDLVLYALLEERLQDHVAGAVGGVARAAYRSLAVARGVTAESALVDATLGRAVERKAELLQVVDGVDGFLAHDFGGVLVDEVVATLDGVERVPLPVVLLDVGEGRAHAALRRAGVGAGGVELGQYGGAAAGP